MWKQLKNIKLKKEKEINDAWLGFYMKTGKSQFGNGKNMYSMCIL